MSDSNSPHSSNGNSVSSQLFGWQQIELIRKELRETLRDRRTIVTLLAMPLLLYPLLGLAFRFLALQQSAKSASVFRIAFEKEDDAGYVMSMLALAERLSADTAKAEEPSDGSSRSDTPVVKPVIMREDSPFDLESMIRSGSVDVGARVSFQSTSGQPSWTTASVEIIENSGSTLSRSAANYIERSLAEAGLEQVKVWGRSIHSDFQLPVQQSRSRLNAESQNNAVLGLLPLILLLMTVTGGVYPAIDLTAGERERNTLETLMSLPVPKFRLLFAKFVAVVSVTMLTGVMNLTAMSVTLNSLQLDKALLGGVGFSIGLGAKLFLALSAFALFYSAVLLLLTSSARSFKEAQAYLIPLLLLSIGPGLVIMLPGWGLDQRTAVIPLVNILLLTKEFLEGTATFLPSVAAILSTVLYGIAALAIASHVFGSDAVAVGSRGRWRELFQRPDQPQSEPTASLALIGLAILFPAYFVASGLLSRGEGIAPQTRLIMSAALTFLLFAVLPALIMIWQRIDLRRGFGIVATKVGFFLGALLIGFSAWPWIFEIVVWSQGIGLRGLDPSKFEQVKEILEGWKQVPLPLIILALGVMPGVCEECFFRGFIFSGLRQHLSGRSTVLVTAIAFGVFHVILAGGAAPERLIPSTLMGLILGWVRWKSNSLLPGVLLHTIHNSTLLAMAQYRDELSGWGLGTMHETHLPLLWLGVSSITLLLGVLIIFLSRARSKATNTSGGE